MTERVLVVDEDEDILAIIETFLERRKDLSVSTETDPKRAAKRVIDGEFGAVVSDLSMPKVDGLELCQRIREERTDVTFLLFTGTEEIDVPEGPGKACVTAFVQKGTGTDQYETLAEHVLSDATQESRG